MSATQNGTAVQQSNGESGGPLRILIAGAGIAGLSAAIGLRQQGHQVTVVESSSFKQEVGAAVHIAPNANGVLKKLGIDMAAKGANKFELLNEYDPSGNLSREMDMNKANSIWQHDWLLGHRIQLHESLERAATATEGEGEPVKLVLGKRVMEVDPVEATMSLEDGSTLHGDVVIGADGVHSRSRKAVPGCDCSAFSSGKSAFRFMIPMEKVKANPKTAKLIKHDGQLTIWYAQDRRIVAYPTSKNTLLNFVCPHPDQESEASGETWTTDASQDRLQKVYKGFPEACLELVSMADPSEVKTWKLLDMQVLPTFVHERLALIGDAAHPFLPHQGQGAGVSIEDAVALSVFLERGLSRKEVPERIKLYNDARYERANKIQHYSRLAGRDITPEGAANFDMQEYTNYNLGHDEFDHSSQMLREHKWSRQKNIYWRMPIAFGPMPGPRQNHYGVPRQATHSTFRTAAIKFKTSRTNLQNLIPPGKKMRFISPGTVAYASFACTTLDKMEWLGNTGYTHLGLYIHGVEFEKQDGSKISGTYMPLLFESLTDPIVSGREELGMPKLYTAIDTNRGGSSFRIQTSWQGSKWGNFHLSGLEEEVGGKAVATGKVSGEDDDGIIVFRYMPQVGRDFKGIAETTYPVFVPFAEDLPKPVTRKVYKASGAKIDIDGMDWDALPTLHHVVSRLADIPRYEIVSAKVVEGDGVPDVSQAMRVE